jgi:acid phosphatase type 7
VEVEVRVEATRSRYRTGALFIATLAFVLAGAGAGSSGAAQRAGSDPVVAAVGDLVCAFGTRTPPHHAPGTADRCQPEKVARIVRHRDFQAFLPLGDLQYSYGSAWRFFKFWDRYYGDVTSMTRPVPGNHEGYNGLFRGYFAYFGNRAHPPGGYYSYDLGSWHIIALNSQMCRNRVWGLHVHKPSNTTSTGYTHWISPIPGGGCKPGDRMWRWLKRDLNRHPNSSYPCTLAYFHHPLFRASRHNISPRDRDVLPIFRLLYRRGADLVLNGHTHNYERWEPLDPLGKRDPDGITEFIVGTGGDSYQPLPDRADLPTKIAAAQDTSYGLLRLRLEHGGYDYRWITAADQPAFRDIGSGVCH